MDEVPVPFGMVSGTTVHFRGSDSVKINTTGHEKQNMTVVLSVLASGDKLKPLVIFKKRLTPKRDFPSGAVIKVNKKGWMNESIMMEWIQEVWRERGNREQDPEKSLLMLDFFSAHRTERVRAELKHHSQVTMIPDGLTV